MLAENATLAAPWALRLHRMFNVCDARDSWRCSLYFGATATLALALVLLVFWRAILVASVKLGLRKVGSATHVAMERARAGNSVLVITGLHVAAPLLLAVRTLVCAESCEADEVRVTLPSLRSLRFCVHCQGLRIRVRQRQRPMYEPNVCGTVAGEALSKAQRRVALDAVEAVLWKEEVGWARPPGPCKGKTRRARKVAGQTPFTQGRLFRLASKALRCVAFEVSGVSVIYQQDEGEGLEVTLGSLFYRGQNCSSAAYKHGQAKSKSNAEVCAKSFDVGQIGELGLVCCSISVFSATEPALRSPVVQQWSAFVRGGSDRGGTLHCNVELKALALELRQKTLASLVPLSSKLLHYMTHETVWKHRPQHPVHRHAASWWKYAIHSVLSECRIYRVSSCGLRDLQARRLRRLRYIAAYREVCVQWWKPFRARRQIRSKLQAFEEELSLEEIAHFRAFFRYSQCKKKSAWGKALPRMGLVDAIVGDPTAMAQMLLESAIVGTKSSLPLCLELSLPKLSVHLDHGKGSSNSITLMQLQIDFTGSSGNVRCSQFCMSNSLIPLPLLMSEEGHRQRDFFSFAMTYNNSGHIEGRANVGALSFQLSKEWLGELSSLVEFASDSSGHFREPFMNPAALVQDTFTRLMAKPPPSPSPMSISFLFEGLTICIPFQGETEIAALDGVCKGTHNQLKLLLNSLSGSYNNAECSSSTLRGYLLHKKKRTHYESILPCVLSKVEVVTQLSLEVWVGPDERKEKDAEIISIISIPSFHVQLKSEQSPIPKALFSSVALTTVILPEIEMTVSQARLVFLFQAMDSLKLPEAEHDLAPARDEAPENENIKAKGRTDGVASYWFHCDRVSVSFVEDEEDERSEDVGTDAGAPMVQFGLCDVWAKYCKDSYRSRADAAFGLCSVLLHSPRYKLIEYILGPMLKHQRTIALEKLSRNRNGARDKWTNAKAKVWKSYLCSSKGLLPQVQGSLSIHGSDTMVRVHVAHLSLQIDAVHLSPLMSYFVGITASIPQGDSSSKAAPVESSAIQQKAESSLLLSFEVAFFSCLMSLGKKEVGSMSCTNVFGSQCTKTGYGVHVSETEMRVEDIEVKDLLNTHVIMAIHPPDNARQDGFGLCLGKLVTETHDLLEIRIAKLNVLFLNCFVKDMRMCIAQLSEALAASSPPEEINSVEVEQEGVDGAPPAELQRAVKLTLSHVELDLPISSQSLANHFQIKADAVEVMTGYAAEKMYDECNVEGVPSLAVTVKALRMSYENESLAPLSVIPHTNLICYMEAPSPGQSRVVLLWEHLCVNLSQPVYANLMGVLSGNLGEASIFEPKVTVEVEVPDRKDFAGPQYSYQEAIGFPSEDSASFELCISSSDWKVNFQDPSSFQTFCCLSVRCPAFAYRSMAKSGNAHVCLNFAQICLTDMLTSHWGNEVMKGDKAESEECPGSVDDALKFVLVMMADGTMIMEIKLNGLNVSWPYLTDARLLTKVLGTLSSVDPDKAQNNVAVALPVPSIKAWMHVNISLQKLAILVPLPPVPQISLVAHCGILISVQKLTFRYSCGGDGETVMACKVISFEAAFNSDTLSSYEPFILPFSADLSIRQRCPVFEEQVEALRRVKTVIKVQRWWRAARGRLAELFCVMHKRPASRMPVRRAFVIEHGTNPNEREVSQQEVSITLDNVVVKASFSEVYLWKAVLETDWGGKPSRGEEESSTASTREGSAPSDVDGTVFRPSTMGVDMKVNSLSFVVQDDRPRSYGKPDVLRLHAHRLQVKFDKESREEDAEAATRAKVIMSLSAKYLDSSISRYNTILEPWDLKLEYSQVDNAYGGQNKSMWINSDARAELRISPHLLLALGDVMTFQKLLTTAPSRFLTIHKPRESLDSCAIEGGNAADLDVAPQKYCLNNYSGLALWYWSSPQSAGHRVADKERVIVQSQPILVKKAIISKTSGVGATPFMNFEALNFQFEGNWSPLQNVNVSLVGKYRYLMKAPLDKVQVPVIVDVVLCGRTKVISVHSPYWLFNKTDQDLFFRLQQKIGSLAAPLVENKGTASATVNINEISSDLGIGPLCPGEGCYLPVTAAIKSEAVLYISIVGNYQEATSQQIHVLSVDEMDSQQQMLEFKAYQYMGSGMSTPITPMSLRAEFENIAEGSDSRSPSQFSTQLSAITGFDSDPPEEDTECSSFYCCLRVLKVAAQVIHLHSFTIDSVGMCPSPSSIECELSFQPPLVVTNALPYDMRVSLMGLSRVGRNGPTSIGDLPVSSQGFVEDEEEGALLKPGGRADIYCNFRAKQKLMIKVYTGLQGILANEAPLLIHHGETTERKAELPSHVPMDVVGVEPGRRDNREIELTTVVASASDGTPRVRTQFRYLQMPYDEVKQKVWLGVENNANGPTGREVTIFCPYWIDNQTSTSLFFSEKETQPAPGKKRRRDEVLAPCAGEKVDTALPVLLSTKKHTIFFRVAGETRSPFSPPLKVKQRGASGHNPISLYESIHRPVSKASKMYHVSVEILPCPPDSIYRNTKVISIRNAIIIENMSSFTFEYTQSGIMDDVYRHVIASGASCDHHWDSTHRPLEIMVRPCGMTWNWSSEFPLLGTGDTYFGLRLSHRDQDGVFLIIPVSITVSSRYVLVSFKDPSADPPYRIQNDCKEVSVSFKQEAEQQSESAVAMERLKSGVLQETRIEQAQQADQLTPRNPETTVLPGTSVGYAWDVPTWKHKLNVWMKRVDARDATANVSYSIDELGDRNPVTLSEIRRSGSKNLLLSASRGLTAKNKDERGGSHLEKKLKGILAKELAQRVFVTIYADGPTRVLRFSDQKDTAAIQADLSAIEMHTRLKKLEDELANDVNRRFASLQGIMKSRPLALDLYGRNTSYVYSDRSLRSKQSSSRAATPLSRTKSRRHSTPKSKRSMTRRKGKEVKVAEDILEGEMKSYMKDSLNAVLSLGGELTLTVHGASGLKGNPTNTHTFAEVELDGKVQNTPIIFSSCDPDWDETMNYASVSATDILEVRVIGISSQRCTPVACRGGATKTFLGSARIPLLETFTMDNPDNLYYVLGNARGTEVVTGGITVSISWRISANNLLEMKVDAFERVLAQRIEILSQMSPMSPEDWEQHASNAKRREALLNHGGYQRGTVSVTVLEARGLKARVSFQPLATLDLALDGPLCDPYATVSCVRLDEKKAILSSNVASQTLRPIFDQDRRLVFDDVPLSGSFTLDLFDRTSMGRATLLGTRKVMCSEVASSSSFRPVYAWVRLRNPKGEALAGGPELFVRMQWSPPQRATKSTQSLNVTLCGVGVACISGGVGGELLNLTLDQLSYRRMTNEREKVVSGAIKSVQIDNQLASAIQPVVLQPLVGHSSGDRQPDFLHASYTERFTGKKGTAAGSNIRSIKDFHIRFGALKLEVDDLFLDGVLHFVQVLPVEDLWQDDLWDERQSAMLDIHTQFGPREIENACGVKRDQKACMGDSPNPADWYHGYARDQMQNMRALSSSSSWYFIEKAVIGGLRITLSLSITSKILPGSGGEEKSLLNRALNTSGLQLLDVDDAPLQIDGLSFVGEVIGVNALRQRITQHLQWQAISEAHKVLGGSGPAIAGAPLSVVYAFSSVYTVGQEITAGKLGPLVAMQQIGFITFSAVAQAIGACSKTLVLVLAVIPTDDEHGEWADSKTLKRYSGKPVNAPSSLYLGLKEALQGFVRGVSGIVSDPVWAVQKGGAAMFVPGLVKGLLGLPIRPFAGFLEFSSRTSQGLALLCLGREGIEGVLPHRVRAPIVFQEQAQKGAEVEEGEDQDLISEWRGVLARVARSLRREEILHCVNLDKSPSWTASPPAKKGRVENTLLITANKLVLVRSWHKGERARHSVHWALETSAVKQVLGKQEKFKIKLKYLVSFPTACCGEWSFPNTKTVQCSTQDVFNKAMGLISRYRNDEAREEPTEEFLVDRTTTGGLVPETFFLR